ncbi:hypothetical protein PybrP1_011000 [[Pythium] brassicae (nom. inval.)]|nr:hypothetical protein PybrP1_011000 [[Pythium] brassicae (nom. inval.)]
MALHASPAALHELREILTFCYDSILSKLSVREIVEVSYEAGGVYPTLLGYTIGALGTFGFVVPQSIVLRSLSMLLASIFYVQCIVGSDELSSVLLLSVAGATGVACTYVQVLSWKLAFAHVDARRQARVQQLKDKKALSKVVEKED